MASQAGPSMFSASPSRNSLHDASATVDDLTRSLANLSRATTPDLPDGENQESEYTRAWLAVKSKLESQLVLSAEIGQALLQRHEAFVRKVQRDRESRHQPSVDEASIDELQEFDDEPRSRIELEARVAELVQENAVLEKRLNVALLNAEVAESANKELLDEVQDLRSTVNRLSTENARSVGWETRLRNAIQERDDFRQERDAEGQRARIAESRLVALGDKNAELRAQMRQLTDSVDQNYRHRQELSEEILHDARSRLAKLQAYKQTASSVDNDEITGILESLVADNEALVQSNNELQCMLADTREELNTLQEEAEEHRAAASFSPYDDTFSNRPSSRAYRRPGSRMTYGTAPGPISPLSVAMSARRGHRHKRSLSSDIPKHEFEPLTPQTNVRALSPDPFDAPGPTFQSMGPPPSEDHTLVGGDLDEHASGLTRTSPNRRKQAPSHRHQGVQTDAWTSSLFPDVPGSQLLSDFSSSFSPNDGLSESSSLTDNPSTLKSLLDRISQLLGRMTQADALSLTSRLKRQNIVGADVSYISRSTVESIVADVTNLRGALRSALEDDKFTTVCSRSDLKVILKLFRELFRELGTLRIMLNDIVLDPSLAPKVREMVFHPQKAEQQAAAKAAAAAASAAAATTAAGWMAPLSKLFGGVSAGTPSQPIRPPSRSVSRPAPKAPVLPSASTTTVNVEFTPKGARATTESSPRTLGPSVLPNRVPSSFAATSSTPSRQVSSSVMGIFAGAPRTDPNADPWVVVKASSKLRPKTPASGSNALAPPRPDASRGERRVSRNVEAMLDADETQALNGQLLERTLRPRGLSDSSIRSTFLQHGELPASSAVNAAPPGRQGVFQAFTQRVSAAVAGTTSLENRAPSPSMESLHRRVESGGTLPRALSPGLARLLPEMSWGMGDEVVADPDEYIAGHRRRGDMPWMRGARGREI